MSPIEVITLARMTLEAARNEDGLVLETDDEILSALSEEGVTVNDALSRLGTAVLDAEAMVEMTEIRMTNLAARRDRYKRRAQLLRGTLQQSMDMLGLKKFRDAEFSVAVMAGKPKVIITDIDALPESCIRTKREPDKTILRWRLEQGPVPGAELSNAESYLTIRST